MKLVLFLSRATPLQKWNEMGILGREIAIYKRLSTRLERVSLVTSGGESELAYQPQLGNIRILHNRWGLSPNVYSLLALFLHAKELREADVYKNNQPDGSWTAVLAGKLYRKPVIARAGYLWAELHREEGGRGFKAALIDRLQRALFKHAKIITLTTSAMKQQVVANYNVRPEKITVIPNYVDTDLFCPRPEIEPIKGQICFVGRLHPVKNLDLLIEAVAQLPGASLVIIGDGPQRQQLDSMSQQRHLPVQFSGILEQEQIPLELNRSQIFILPSRSEGHPKALIEAMACGTAVIGTDVEGIRDVIQHEVNGLLCPPTVEGMKDALHRLLADEPLRIHLGQNAHDFARRAYSLDRIIELELAVLQQVV